MTVKAVVRRWLERIPGAVPLARLVLETIRVCLSYRVTGLAAEGGFFMLLSLPPFVLGLFGGVGYLGIILGPDGVERLTTLFRSRRAHRGRRGICVRLPHRVEHR